MSLLKHKILLGKILLSEINGSISTGIIVGTKAYFGIEEKESHAYSNCLSNRTEIMYNKGDVDYVYLTYGIHHMLHIVTSGQNNPKCVLIRRLNLSMAWLKWKYDKKCPQRKR